MVKFCGFTNEVTEGFGGPLEFMKSAGIELGLRLKHAWSALSLGMLLFFRDYGKPTVSIQLLKPQLNGFLKRKEP